MALTNEHRAALRAHKALLEKGPLNWSDADIAEIASFTAISVEDLTVMRHKMERASQWSTQGLQALDALIEKSPDPARLRKRIERSTSVRDGIERVKTYTGLFLRIKDHVNAIDADLANDRQSERGRRCRPR